MNNSLSISQLKKLDNFHLQKLNTTKNQFEIYSDIFNFFDSTFIFESLSGPEELAETSIIGFNPSFTVKCNSKNFIICNRNKKIVKILKVREPLSQLRSILPKITLSHNKYRFIGGAVGYISYEAISFWERLPAPKKKILNFPLFEFGIFTDGILYDHKQNQAYYFHNGTESQIEELNKILYSDAHTFDNNELKNKNSYLELDLNESNVRCSVPQRNLNKTEFIKMVRKAQRYIYDGDIFQVVLSKNFKFNIEGNLLRVYSSLRKLNPSPYMYLFKINKRCIIGSSPEMLLRVTGKVIETFPIAGTRPIGQDEEETTKLGESLLQDEKELAEHTMLVDLARNDVGHVSDYGSVNVKSLMVVKRFSHVQHIVSHVVGHLSDSFDVFDALKSLFPAGTVSGAPKVRAMEIINELEKERREPYAGALGYFSFNGCCDFAITIRSIFINGKKGYIQSGAGIVMDSIPSNEWEETERKAEAMMSVLKDIKNHTHKRKTRS
ncbi:MAG TPA: chorismate-binding protein [Nitrososphaeraceae archaeon]|nr:chorismate-binding protein [Nitrososphaeraceae archaeon]